MKRLFICLFCSMCVFGAYADNNIATSKDYVDAQVETLQDEVPAIDSNAVLTHTGISGEIGSKKIYDINSDYGSQTDALVTAGTFNAAVQNAIDSEFVCIDWLGEHVPGNCLLWQIHSNALPNGYTRLEYLESTGTEYIDTGIVLLYDTDIGYWKAKISFLETFKQLGADYNAILDGQGDYLKTVGSGGPVYSLGTAYDIIVGLNTNHNRYLTIDGQTYNGTMASQNTHIMIYALGVSYDTTGMGRRKMRVYNFSIVKNDILVRNFIPARRNSDGVLGMYDTVSETFFTNAGTGEFVAGPDIDSNIYLPNGN